MFEKLSLGICRLSKLNLAPCSVTALLLCPKFVVLSSSRCVHATSGILCLLLAVHTKTESVAAYTAAWLTALAASGRQHNFFFGGGGDVNVSVGSVLLFRALYRGDIIGKKQRRPL